jgi:HAD superfamily hydrolase (TIGR01509 family)
MLTQLHPKLTQLRASTKLHAQRTAVPCSRHVTIHKLSSSPLPQIAFTSSRIAPARASTSSPLTTAAASAYTAALIFDCDGVIVETEELHRKAYNAAFEAFGLTIDGTPLVWTVEYYDVLQNTVGGGKPKMRYHFTNNGWPATSTGPVPTADDAQSALIDALQDKKTEVYKKIVEVAANARPGVLELMDEALDRPDLAVCICSAATKAGFDQVVNSVVGPERLARFDIILAGDDVEKKKPDPQIYNIARSRLGLPADRCLVIEDSMVGLRAALGAGMHCIITPTTSTVDAPFCQEGAVAVVPVLAGDLYRIGVDDLFVMRDGEMVPNVDPELEGDVCAVDWGMVTPNPFASTMTG